MPACYYTFGTSCDTLLTLCICHTYILSKKKKKKKKKTSDRFFLFRQGLIPSEYHLYDWLGSISTVITLMILTWGCNYRFDVWSYIKATDWAFHSGFCLPCDSQLLPWLFASVYHYFGALKYSSRKIYKSPLNICFSYRNVSQNGVNVLSKWF